MNAGDYIIGFIVIFAAFIWVAQFLSLLEMPRSRFMHEENKLIWAIALIVLGIFGAILFWIFKPGGLTDRPVSTQEDAECLNCRSTIPAALKSCPHCGWTYT